jgi:hypothetical protein
MSGNVEDAALLQLRLSSFNRLQRTHARRIAPVERRSRVAPRCAPKNPFRLRRLGDDRSVLRQNPSEMPARARKGRAHQLQRSDDGCGVRIKPREPLPRIC